MQRHSAVSMDTTDVLLQSDPSLTGSEVSVQRPYSGVLQHYTAHAQVILPVVNMARPPC